MALGLYELISNINKQIKSICCKIELLINSGVNGTNIYNSNGTLTEDRVVNLDSHDLSFTGSGRIGLGTSTPEAPFHINSTAIPSSNETLARFTVSDAPVAYLDLRNGSVIDGNFVGQVVGRQSSTSTSSALFVDGFIDQSQDITSSNSVMLFRTAKITGSVLSSLTTRLLYDFRSWTTSLFRIYSSGNVAIGSTTEVPSAKLDVSSTTSGFLPPRMTAIEAEAIVSPAEGLMVYSTTGTGVTITSKGWWGYDGSTWVKLN